MYLVRLNYASTFRDGFDQNDIEQVLEISRKINTAKHISDILFFGHRYFLQCLEGARSAVNEIYH